MLSTFQRPASVLAALLFLPAVLVAGEAGAAPPEAVTKSQSATITVQASQIHASTAAHHGVAFAIDADGTYLTAYAVVARHGRLAIRRPVGGLTPARRVPSTAPTGVAMLRAAPAARASTLTVTSGTLSKGDTVWAAAPQPQTKCAVLTGNRAIHVTSLGDAGVVHLDVPASCFAQSETFGTPLVDRDGHVRAVAVAGPGRAAVALALSRLPRQTEPFTVAPSSDDIPVPVVVGIVGALLLLASLLFARRRRAVARGSSPVPAVASGAGNARPVPDDGPALDISLKPKSKPAASSQPPVEGIELRRP